MLIDLGRKRLQSELIGRVVSGSAQQTEGKNDNDEGSEVVGEQTVSTGGNILRDLVGCSGRFDGKTQVPASNFKPRGARLLV